MEKNQRYWIDNEEFDGLVGYLDPASVCNPTGTSATWTRTNVGYSCNIIEDHEIDAMNKIVMALLSLDDEARRRVLEYIEGRFDRDQSTTTR